ncbi:hypothetical protein Cgig2_017611 [Carnegiea gigantea]|uniref:RRM domain-containing protein n=1 Tax=Carnegiea gigantea TaxID=171969 RepID=A0A9Q1GPV7_9CARY|nr:hypothetical protein Cgig2_017611 [Carnegiea gigantea]
MRENQERARKTGERREYSVFVYSLPTELDRHGLQGIFQRAGQVIDTYIPQRKTRRSNVRFGFVRTETQRAWRREEKQPLEPNNKDTDDRPSQESQLHNRTLVGEINEDFEEWLCRSLVCTTEEPRDLVTLASAVNNGYGLCSKICALSSFKLILTFPTMEQMEEAFTNHEELDLWFSNIKKWSTYDSCESRKVWLEVFGVPPRGWCWENFNKIASLWEGYRLMIRELGPAVQMAHIDHGPLINPPLEEMDSNDEVLGFDDLMENLDATNGLAQSNTKLTDPSLRDQGRDAA